MNIYKTLFVLLLNKFFNMCEAFGQLIFAVIKFCFYKFEIWIKLVKRNRANLRNLEPGMRVMASKVCYYKENKYLTVEFEPFFNKIFEPGFNKIRISDTFTILSIINIPKQEAYLFNTKQYTFIDDNMQLHCFRHSPNINGDLIEEIFESDFSKFELLIKKGKDYGSESCYRVLC